MKKALLLGSFILISTAAFAFGGGGSHRTSSYYQRHMGMDSIGIHMHGGSQVDIAFVECEEDDNASYVLGECKCNEGYERVSGQKLCQLATCSENHPELCEVVSDCEAASCVWCAIENKCIKDSAVCCAMDNLSACKTKRDCLEADGSWVNDACQEAVCDMDHLDLCENETACDGALGFWCGRRDECVAIEEDCICDAGYALNYGTGKCELCDERHIRTSTTPYNTNASSCNVMCSIGEKANDTRTECVACDDDELCGCTYARQGETCINDPCAGFVATACRPECKDENKDGIAEYVDTEGNACSNDNKSCDANQQCVATCPNGEGPCHGECCAANEFCSGSDSSTMSMCLQKTSGCATNKDCPASQYCQIEASNYSYTTHFYTTFVGTCTPIGTKQTAVYDGVTYTYTDTTMNFWSAKNWCYRQGLSMIDFETLGCRSPSAVCSSTAGTATAVNRGFANKTYWVYKGYNELMESAMSKGRGTYAGKTSAQDLIPLCY